MQYHKLTDKIKSSKNFKILCNMLNLILAFSLWLDINKKTLKTFLKVKISNNELQTCFYFKNIQTVVSSLPLFFFFFAVIFGASKYTFPGFNAAFHEFCYATTID